MRNDTQYRNRFLKFPKQITFSILCFVKFLFEYNPVVLSYPVCGTEQHLNKCVCMALHFRLRTALVPWHSFHWMILSVFPCSWPWADMWFLWPLEHGGSDVTPITDHILGQADSALLVETSELPCRKSPYPAGDTTWIGFETLWNWW